METANDVIRERRELLDRLESAKSEIHKVLLGLNNLIETVLYCLISPGRHHRDPYGGNLLIEGAHGLGKTLLVKTLGRVLGLSFSRIQFVVDTDPSSITGSSIKKEDELVFKPGALFANLILADEITRASAKIQSAMFEGMEELTVTVDGVTHKLPRPFFVLATTNIAEEIGSVLYQLPMGQRDRFYMSRRIEPLSERLERKLYERTVPQMIEGKENQGWGGVEVEQLDKVLDASWLERISLFIARNYPIPVGSPMNVYLTNLTRATRLEQSVLYGASHRAGIDLVRAAQTAAFLADDDIVTEQHVLRVFGRVMRHRMLLAQQYEQDRYATRQNVEDILYSILGRTPLFEGMEG